MIPECAFQKKIDKSLGLAELDESQALFFTMTDESPRSRTSSMDTTASPPGSLSSSPESGPGHKQPRQVTGHNISNESHSSSGRVYSPDNLPFSLSHIKKSPRIVLGNKLRKQSGLTPASELKSRSQIDAAEKSEKPLSSKIEEAINMRLFYLGIIKDLADVNRKAPEGGSPSSSMNRNFRTLKRRKEDLIHELNVVKGLIHESERRMVGLAQHINNLAVEINHVKTLTREEEERHMEAIRIYQVAINKVAKETEGFEGLGGKSPPSNFSTPPPVFFKRFNSGSFSNSSFSPSAASLSISQTPPSQSSNLSFTPPSREVSFSGTLFALSGQLAEFSQGEFGSQLITKRISEGSDMERDLVWSELRLPGSLVSILVSGNQFSKEVVLALANNSLALRKELVTTIGREEKTIRMIEGGKEFIEELSSNFTRV